MTSSPKNSGKITSKHPKQDEALEATSQTQHTPISTPKFSKKKKRIEGRTIHKVIAKLNNFNSI